MCIHSFVLIKNLGSQCLVSSLVYLSLTYFLKWGFTQNLGHQQTPRYLSISRTGVTDMCHLTRLLCGCWHLNPGPPIWTASPSSTKTISHVPSCSILSGVLLLGWNDWIWDIKWKLTPYYKQDWRLGTVSQPCSLKRSPTPRLTE